MTLDSIPLRNAIKDAPIDARERAQALRGLRALPQPVLRGLDRGLSNCGYEAEFTGAAIVIAAVAASVANAGAVHVA